ncbi:MAG: hypothetical protein EDR02_04320 [Actinobacteria bacterium]|nr:MAG: hypothetical protein EDR02_04320 [Actinomycetota bacterium]
MTMSEESYVLAAAVAAEPLTTRTTEMLGFFFIALLVFGPLAFLLYYRHRDQATDDVVIDLRDATTGQAPHDAVLATTVGEVLEEIDRIADDLQNGRLAPGGTVEVFVARAITIEGNPVEDNIAISIILDSSRDHGLVLDETTPVEGGRVLRFRLTQASS